MPVLYDYIIIGSGFGGSVSALRLAEKGYKVLVVEKGRRYRSEDFPKTNWNLRKFLWMPKIFLYGIQALTLLKDVFILHGVGVGGGSLVYANNLLIPPDKVFDDPAWGNDSSHNHNWKDRLAPHYATAKKMLGANPSKAVTQADSLLKELAEEMGKGDTFHVNDVSVFFGEPDETVPDPYFDGKGPDRTGCNFCGGCMVGCRYGAKNSLDKNYLYLAEKLGVQIVPDTIVTDVKPADDGYTLSTRKVTGIFGGRGQLKAKGVIFAGGVMGSVKLLHRCKANGSLSNISDQLGNYVRTNSEALVGAVAGKTDEDYSKGLAISTGVYPDEHTHIEAVRYSKGSDAMAALTTLLVGGGKWPRPLLFIGQIFRHPLKFLKSLWPFDWARRTIILLVMQTHDNYMRLQYKRRWWRLGGRSMNTFWDTDKKVPSYIPVANDFAARLAEKMNGTPFSGLPEVLFDTPTTAHILGGCIMSDSPDHGVIGFDGKIHGYDNLYVVDGSIVPANLGVNPSLSITALAEYVMSQVEAKR